VQKERNEATQELGQLKQQLDDTAKDLKTIKDDNSSIHEKLEESEKFLRDMDARVETPKVELENGAAVTNGELPNTQAKLTQKVGGLETPKDVLIEKYKELTDTLEEPQQTEASRKGAQENWTRLLGDLKEATREFEGLQHEFGIWFSFLQSFAGNELGHKVNQLHVEPDIQKQLANDPRSKCYHPCLLRLTSLINY
jgi:chromosome segregation ATPase